MSALFSAWTVFVALIFFGIVVWVLRTDKAEFDEAAQIPFNEEEQPGSILKEENHG